MGINSRIARVVAESGLTKSAFSEKIKISQPFLSQLCSGVKSPSDRTISDICREFGILEEWLRTGEGPMKVQVSQKTALARAMGRLATKNEPLREAYLSMLMELDEKELAFFYEKAKKLVELYEEAGQNERSPNILKIAGRDGSYKEMELTDSQLEELKRRIDQLPDASEDL